MSQLFRTTIIISLSLLASCNSCGTIDNSNRDDTPDLILWAWERSEDLKFIGERRIGVAFLEQTLALDSNEVIHIPRRQPLKVESNTFLIAVTRIEMKKGSKIVESSRDQMISKVVSRIVKSSGVKNVQGVQIDFDAVQSERDFYRRIVTEVRQKLPKETSLSITALASWCTYDTWLKGLPIDEAVPMLFDMGRDGSRIAKLLRNDNDWKEPLCRKSYGLSVNQPSDFSLKKDRRRYYFNARAWRKFDLKRVQ